MSLETTTDVGSTWAGSHRYRAAELAWPESVDELCAYVAARPRVRALGSRHSFTDLADTDGSLVSVTRLPRTVEVDTTARTVRVSAGTTYADLSAELDARGWALAGMASLPHITVGGAISTGTHGSGDGVRSLAGAVAGLELVTAGGDLLTVRRGDPDFAGHVVSLGALGVLTHVTLDVEPTYDVHQSVLLDVTLDTVVEQLDTIMGSAHSVSVFTDWVDDARTQVWRKSRTDTPALPHGRVATEPTHMLLGGEIAALTEQLDVPGPWHQRLPHFRAEFTPSRGAELQTEYFVARHHAPAAIEALRALGPQLAEVLQVTEIRSIAGDDLWLSGAYDGDAVGLHFTWELDHNGVYARLPLIEAALEPFTPRAHWGKCFTLDASRLRAAYPRLGDFASLRERVDPSGTFDNVFLQRVLGG